MLGILLGAIASLSGVIIGSIATYLSQERLWKRTTRRELYGNFVGKSNVCRDSLLDVAYALRRLSRGERAARWIDERNTRWKKANEQIADVSSLAAQVSMVATAGTRSAAEGLEQHLQRLRVELYDHTKNDTMPETALIYHDAYSVVLKTFVTAASRELGITRT
jgi:hypothetical protein